MSFSDRVLSVERSSVCLYTFHIFIFFPRTTAPISTKLSTKHPLVKWIQVCSNEGLRPSPRGNNNEIAKICENLKIFISRTIEFNPFQPKLAQSILALRGYKFVQRKGHVLFQWEIITNLWKNIDFKNLLLQNHWANFNHTWRKASCLKGIQL